MVVEEGLHGVGFEGESSDYRDLEVAARGEAPWGIRSRHGDSVAVMLVLTGAGVSSGRRERELSTLYGTRALPQWLQAKGVGCILASPFGRSLQRALTPGGVVQGETGLLRPHASGCSHVVSFTLL